MEKDGHVFSEILPQPVQAVVKSALNRKTPLGDTAHILRFRGYSVLMYFGCEKPYFLRNGRPFSPVSSMDHATPLWLYWLYAGKRLSKFQGISRGTFGLHLKECEFRFNTRGKDIYTMLLGEFRRRPIELEDDNQDADRQQNTLKSHYWDLVKGEVGFTYRDFPEEALRGLPEA
ncbi:MAG: hypothetical protein JRK53_25775 [Deltaproteobacteria bacterium]|nr:hypothetical protein [Deltaproteobacteria bacterium]